MIQLIGKPTRITSTCKTLIDLIFTTLPPELTTESGTLDVLISDHLPVYVVKKKKRERHSLTEITIRNDKLYNAEIFRNIILTDMRWRHFWNCIEGPEKLWHIWLEIVEDSLNTLCPLKNITIREGQMGWFDGEIKKAIISKKSIHRKACKSNQNHDWDRLRVAKRNVRKLIMQKKCGYIIGKLEEFRNVVNIQVETPNGEKVEGYQAACETNRYYSKVGETLASKFQSSWNIHAIHQTVYIPNMQFRFIGEKETIALIRTLPVHKSSQVKNVPMLFLKDALLATHFEISYILNECLYASIMPNEWKKGTITPIPKKPLSKNVVDYRPISVLPAPSKLIERAVHNQIVYHLDSYGLLDCRQHGFRKNHSTSTAIFTLVQYIYEKLDDRQYVGCIYVDYSKAFDTLDHVILCKKLETFGLSKNVVNWCRNYLQSREQMVKIDKHLSEPANLTYGVPQGSILGPLFFIMYVNDVITTFDENSPNIILYADDTAIYYAHNQLEELEKQLAVGMKKLCDWCNLNKLTINFQKTKYTIFKPKCYQNISHLATLLEIDGNRLEEVSSYNYLGVIIDNTLVFDGFLREKCKRINLRLYQLGKLRKYITCDLANTVYKQTIIPIFDYADFLIESGQNKYVTRLNDLHVKGLRIIDCNKHAHATDTVLEKEYGLLTPTVRRHEHHSAIMYRQCRVVENLDVYRPPMTNKKIKFRRQNRNLKGIEKSPMMRGIKIWDMLPSGLQRATTKVKFKTELKKLIRLNLLTP